MMKWSVLQVEFEQIPPSATNLWDVVPKKELQ
jgi:hypothetical protein